MAKLYHISVKTLCTHLETLGIDLNRKYSEKELIESRRMLLCILKNLLEIRKEQNENINIFKK